MRVLVTGANGFVGEHAVRVLTQRGHECVGTFTGPLARTRTLGPGEGPARWLPCELRDRERVRAVVEEVRPDGVLHLAGVSSVGRSWQEPLESFDVNATGALHLLEALRRLPPGGERRPVVLVGSAESYGRSGTRAQPLTESMPLEPLSPYGASKAAQEMLGWALGRGAGLRFVATRSFPHVGPGQRPPFVVADWILQLLRIRRGESPGRIRVGRLDVVREYLDVRDVVRAYADLLETETAEGAFNVCGGHALSLADLLELIQRAVGTAAEVEVEDARVRPAEIASLVGDDARLRAVTGWRPRSSVESAITDLVAELAAESGYDMTLPPPPPPATAHPTTALPTVREVPLQTTEGEIHAA